MLIDTDRLTTVAEYAKLLNVTTMTVYNRISTGMIETIKIGEITLVIKPENENNNTK